MTITTAAAAIVGAGPAGIAAAIQLKRYGITPLLFEKGQVGGLLLNANRINNYPGFPEGVQGPRLVALFRKQLQRLALVVQCAEVVELDFSGREFRLSTNDRVYLSGMVLLASGTEAVVPEELAAAPELSGKVFGEIWSLRGLRNKRIAVIGAGDAAFDYALTLARRNRVIILNRSAGRRCAPELWREAAKSSGITYLENARIAKAGTGKGGGVALDYRQQAKKKALEVDLVVAACGRRAHIVRLAEALAGARVELEQRGLLYLAGDVANGSFRQAGIAVGDGIRAALLMAKKIRGA